MADEPEPRPPQGVRLPRGLPEPGTPRQRRSGLWVLAGILGSIVAVVLLAVWAAHHG